MNTPIHPVFNRKFNFSPGPATLPVPVLDQLRDSLHSYRSSGIGVLELSHRGKLFDSILAETVESLVALCQVPGDMTVLFTTGGATQQFSMIPLNFCAAGQQGNYLVTGVWADKAREEAARFTEVFVSGSSQDSNFSYLPRTVELSSNPAYLHFTSNNTIVGTQFRKAPTAEGVPLICDASSDLLSRPINAADYGLIYAGAQKNLGIAGVTVVIVSKSLLKRCPPTLPLMLNYRTYAENDSRYNTPPTGPIFVLGLVLKWICEQGGLAAVEKHNEEKAKLIYDVIDESDFYLGFAEKEFRSRMNLTFRPRDHTLEPQFLREAEAAGLLDLKGHRILGGLRASIYNAFPLEGCRVLADFMRNFAQVNG